MGFVQQVATQAQGSTPHSFSKDVGATAPAAGNTLVVFLALYVCTSPQPVPMSASISDDQGNTYQLIEAGSGPTGTSNGGVNMWLLIAENIVGGSPTWTVNFSPTSGICGGTQVNYEWSAVILEYSGILGVDAGSISIGGGSSVPVTRTTPTLNTTSQQEFVLAFEFVYTSGAETTGANSVWSRVGRLASTTTGGNAICLNVYSQQTGEEGSFSETFSLATGFTLGDWAVGIVGLRLTPEAKPPFVTLETQPGYFDMADSVLACGMPLADYALVKIKYNADLAMVRPESFFMGYFGDGGQFPLPVSPADGYNYSIEELLYLFSLASSKPPLGGFNQGQETFPALDYSGQPVDGFLCDPYQLRPDFGTLTSQGVSTAKRLALQMRFYEHGDVAQNIAEQSYSSGVCGVYCFGQRKSAPLSPVLPGSTLVTNSRPVFYDLPDSAIADGAPITDQMLQAISRNAKLGVFRFEIIFMGYYTHGNVIPTPVGAGGYAYSRSECTFIPQLASSRQPTGAFTPGQILFQDILADLDLFAWPPASLPEQLMIDSSGRLTCTFRGANGVFGQGVVPVYCLAQRYPNLVMASQPVWFEISDESLVGAQVPTAALLRQLNNNAKFGIVAKEAAFMGYFANGNTPPALVSPADGYTYAFHETLYIPVWVSSRLASGLTPGQKTWPAFGGDLGSGTITASPYHNYLNQYEAPAGQLTVNMWQGGTQAQGIVAVYAIGSRQQNPTGTTL